MISGRVPTTVMTLVMRRPLCAATLVSMSSNWSTPTRRDIRSLVAPRGPGRPWRPRVGRRVGRRHEPFGQRPPVLRRADETDPGRPDEGRGVAARAATTGRAAGQRRLQLRRDGAAQSGHVAQARRAGSRAAAYSSAICSGGAATDEPHVVGAQVGGQSHGPRPPRRRSRPAPGPLTGRLAAAAARMAVVDALQEPDVAGEHHRAAPAVTEHRRASSVTGTGRNSASSVQFQTTRTRSGSAPPADHQLGHRRRDHHDGVGQPVRPAHQRADGTAPAIARPGRSGAIAGRVTDSGHRSCTCSTIGVRRASTQQGRSGEGRGRRVVDVHDVDVGAATAPRPARWWHAKDR